MLVAFEEQNRSISVSDVLRKGESVGIIAFIKGKNNKDRYTTESRETITTTKN